MDARKAGIARGCMGISKIRTIDSHTKWALMAPYTPKLLKIQLNAAGTNTDPYNFTSCHNKAPVNPQDNT